MEYFQIYLYFKITSEKFDFLTKYFFHINFSFKILVYKIKKYIKEEI